jgi:hypothetical protein
MLLKPFTKIPNSPPIPAMAPPKQAVAGSACPVIVKPFKSSVTPAAGLFTSLTAGGNPGFSATDFRPRKHTVFDSDPVVNSFDDTPMLRGTTIWQRMSEYKSHDRVRLLTLWETSGSTVSLQAGKRGNPSLQWTSRAMNRGGSTQGLLDRFFSVSLAHAGNGQALLHPSTKPALPRGTSTGKAPPSGPSK